MKTDKYFRLIGRNMKFKVVKEYLAAGFIPSVMGITIDGKFKTLARIEDILFYPLDKEKLKELGIVELPE